MAVGEIDESFPDPHLGFTAEELTVPRRDDRLLDEAALEAVVGCIEDRSFRCGRRDAVDVVELANTYPEVTIVCTQLMWQQFGTAIDLMWRCQNVSIDTSWLHMREAIELLVSHFGEGSTSDAQGKLFAGLKKVYP